VVPAAMVRMGLLLKEKSPATAGASGATDTVRVVASLDGLLRLAVTVAALELLLSLIVRDERARVTVGRSSSLAMVNVTLAGAATPLPPDAVAWTVNSLSGASILLSTAVIVTVPVLVVCPGAMVRVWGLLRVKSPATAGAMGSTDTVRVVASLDGWLRVVVTVDTPPFSLIVRDKRARVTVGRSSSSAMVNVTLSGLVTPLPPDAVAVIVKVLSSASTSLSTAAMVSVPVLVVCPGAMVRMGLLLMVKSPAMAGASGFTDTVRVVASLDGLLRLAVTVAALELPLSLIVRDERARVTVGRSSSAMVNVTLAGSATLLPPDAVAVIVKVLSSASTSLSTAVMVTVPVLVVSPTPMVRMGLLLKEKSPAMGGSSGATDTVRVVLALDGWLRVAVTVDTPAFSLIVRDESSSVAVGRSSSSAMVNVTLSGLVTPLPPDAVAVIVKVLSGASILLSTAVMVTVPVLVVAPAAMVRMGVLLRVKSPATAGAMGSTDTVRVVASLDGLLRLAITVAALELPLSWIVRDERARLTVGRSSSSAMVNVTLTGSSTPLPPDAVAVIVKVLFGASILLSTAVIVTVPVLVVAPAAMVRMGLLLRVKSSATAGAMGSTDTVRVVTSLDGLLRLAVTVAALELPLLLIVRDERARVTVGRSASSAMVNIISST